MKVVLTSGPKSDVTCAYLLPIEWQAYIWNLAISDKNVALKKETDQSSTEGTGVPGRAVDGKYNTHIASDSCAQTMLSMDNRTAWWGVDLGKPHTISAIKIRNRADCCGTFSSNEQTLNKTIPVPNFFNPLVNVPYVVIMIIARCLLNMKNEKFISSSEFLLITKSLIPPT